jgi:hypothetical protein
MYYASPFRKMLSFLVLIPVRALEGNGIYCGAGTCAGILYSLFLFSIIFPLPSVPSFHAGTK